MEKIGVVIVAAGSGKRMGTDIPKQFLLLGDKPILLHTAEKFEKCKEISEIVVVAAKENTALSAEILKDITKLKTVTVGGSERQNSVINGLAALSDNIKYVLIHDSVRPFVSEGDILKIIQDVRRYKACVMSVKTKDTIKICDENGFVKETPDRAFLWNAQTPQAFSLELIKKAYDKIIQDGITVTDDAAAAEYIGAKVKITEGSYTNIKITTPDDLKTGAAILAAQ